MEITAALPGGIKVAPGISYDFFPALGQVQFISVSRRLVEACIWTGDLARSVGGPGRSALIFRPGAPAVRFTAGSMSSAKEEIAPAPCGDLGTFIYEPDPALVRAGLLAEFAAEFDLRLVDPQIAYLTGESDPRLLPAAARQRLAAAAQAFAVLEPGLLALKLKEIEKAGAAHELSSLEIYTRGVQVDISAFRSAIFRATQKSRRVSTANGQGGSAAPASAGQAGALFAFRRGRRHVALLAKPLNLLELGAHASL